jgi:hypothetical protein
MGRRPGLVLPGFDDPDSCRPGHVPVLSYPWLRCRSVWLRVLGPVECSVDGKPVEVSGRLNHALLVALAVDDRVVGVDELVDAL